MAHDIHKDIVNPTSNDIQELIDHACRIDRTVFRVFVILLACLAATASLCRLILRFRQGSRLLLDDWLVLFSTICLAGETASVHHYSQMLYFIDAVFLKEPMRRWMSHNELLKNSWDDIRPNWIDAYITLGWIAIFSVKSSFLVLFHRMIQNVRSSLRIYFWVTCAVTISSGIVIIVLPFALCPYFDADCVKCLKWNRWVFSVQTGIACQLLDISTDLLIISIPIVLLRMSQLRFDHKLRIAMVLCLSLLCIVLSVVRLAGGIHRNTEGYQQFSLVWNSFMLHCEAAIAVMAGSVPALRAIYRTHQKRRTLYGTDTANMSVPLSTRLKGALSLSGGDTLKLAEDKEEQTASKSHISLPTFQIPPLRGLRRNSSVIRPSRRRANSESRSEDPIIRPEEAHLNPQRDDNNHIRITVECTVMSEAASLHDLEDFSEVGNREWVWNEEGGSWGNEGGVTSEVTVPAPAVRTDQADVINSVDPALLGKVMSGVMI